MSDPNRLIQLHELGQSPWLDNLRRGWLTDGELARWVERGIRGPHVQPVDLPEGDQLAAPTTTSSSATSSPAGVDVTDAYWQLVTDDIEGALRLLRPVYDASDGVDGYVSVEVAPELARDSAGTEAAARDLHERIAEPNLYVKIPGTAEGLAPIQAMIGERRSINVTLIFSLERYAEVMEAYLAGLEAAEGDLSDVSSVASFFISRVDTEVDRRLDAIGTDEARALRGRAAVAQAQVAYQRFVETFRGPRWDALVARGRPGAAAAVGVHVHQGPGLPRHDLRRPAHRARHGQHDAGGHDRGVRRPRHRGPHRRRRPAVPPRPRWPPSRTSASTSRTSLACSRSRASPPSPRPSTSSSARWVPRPTSSARGARTDVHGDLVVVDDVPGEFAERVIEAFHARPHDAFSIAVSGGPTARACYQRLADDAGSQIDWWKVDVYWGDERCVPHDEPRLELPPRPGGAARAGRRGQRQLPDVLRRGPRRLPAPPRASSAGSTSSTSASAPTATWRRSSRARRPSTPTPVASS